MKSNYKYLIKNVGLLTISNFASKLLTFFLVPLYTYALSDMDYGIYDIIFNTVSLLVPILTLNIYEAILRFALDRNTDQKEIISIGVRYCILGTLVIIAFLILNHFFVWYKVFDEYAIYFLLLYISYSWLNVLLNFARGIDGINYIAVSGVIGSITLIGLNLILLIPCKMGLTGYFIATISGNGIQVLYLSWKTHIWNYLKKKSDKELERAMRNYSMPLMVNNVAWWLNNVLDRYIITGFCGLAVNGIYAIGGKIPAILGVIQLIFTQAWTLSAVKEFDPNDKNGFFSKTYNLYAFVNVFCCSVIIMFDRPIAHILYSKKFYDAWIYVPFLCIAMVFGALVGHIGGVFSAVKNSKLFLQSSLAGALVNLLLNIILIKRIGAMGGAIATAISYWVVWIIRRNKAKSYINMKIRTVRDYIGFGVLVIQSIVLINDPVDSCIGYLVQFVFVFVIMILYSKELRYIFRIVFNMLVKKSGE